MYETWHGSGCVSKCLCRLAKRDGLLYHLPRPRTVRVPRQVVGNMVSSAQNVPNFVLEGLECDVPLGHPGVVIIHGVNPW